jgi:hypothetical protein
MVERKLRSALHVDIPVKTSSPKLFVLDTNVLMHDPTSLFRFEEHDIFLPMLTLEELDNNKKGTTEVARSWSPPPAQSVPAISAPASR